MKKLKKLKKFSFLAFVVLLAITVILIVVGSQLETVSAHFKTYSEPGISAGVAYKIPSLPAPDAPRPVPAYPQSNSDVNLPVRKSIVDLTPKEKAAFVNALKTVKNTIPQGSKLSIFDQLVLQHVMVAGFEKPFKSSGPASGFNPAHPGHPAFYLGIDSYLMTLKMLCRK